MPTNETSPGFVQTRRPRFKNKPKGTLQIQPKRDKHIFLLLYQYRFVPTSLLVAYLAQLGFSKQGTKRRLTELRHEDFIRKINSRKHFHGVKNPEDIYELGPKGARYLEDSGEVGTIRSRYSKQTTTRYIKHTVAVSRFLIELAISCRRRDIELIDSEEILRRFASKQQRNSKNPYTWRVSINGRAYTVNPDRIFALHFPDAPEGERYAFFFLELDRGTETVQPKSLENLSKSTVHKILRKHYETYQQDLHKKLFNMPHFRMLLFIDPAEEVAEHMARQNRLQNVFTLNQKLYNNGKGSRLFYFSDWTVRRECDDLLKMTWMNGQGEVCTLVT